MAVFDDIADMIDVPHIQDISRIAGNWFVLAQTIFGEAEGENYATKLAIGQVIRNRVKRQWRGAKTYREVCLAHLQFSCWNRGSPRLEAMLNPSGQAWNESLIAAMYVIMLIYDEPALVGVYHYTDTSINPPSWTENMKLVKLPNVPKINFWRG